MKYVFMYHMEDAQWYLIPDSMRADFTELLRGLSQARSVEARANALELFDEVFGNYLCEHPSQYTFTNPILKH